MKKRKDLAKFPLLCSLNRPMDWPTWLAAAKVSGVDGNSGLKFENAALAYQAAADDLGITVAQLALVDEDLRTGRLVAPLKLRVKTDGGYYLQFRVDQVKGERVRVFEEWVVGEAATLNGKAASNHG